MGGQGRLEVAEGKKQTRDFFFLENSICGARSALVDLVSCLSS